MDNNTEKEVLEELEKIFSNVNQWLNFAEVKNGALLAFNFTLLGFLSQDSRFNNSYFLPVLYVIMLISTIIVLISFMPNGGIKIFNILTKYVLLAEPRTNNLLYFEKICFYKNDEYLRAIRDRYFGLDFPNQRDKRIQEQLDYVEEIIINTKITTVKYFLFKLALKLCILAIIIIGVVCIVYIVNEKQGSGSMLQNTFSYFVASNKL